MKVLLATDGTKYGEAAANMLINFDLTNEDEVKIVSVVDMALPLSSDIYGGYLPDTTEIEKAARENAEKVLEAVGASLKQAFGGKQPAISSDVLFGSPDSRIVETAEEYGADLIIL